MTESDGLTSLTVFDIGGRGISRSPPANGRDALRRIRPTAKPFTRGCTLSREKGLAETHPTPARRTQPSVLSFSRKPLIFRGSEIRVVRRVNHPRGVLSIRVSSKALSGASTEMRISRVRRPSFLRQERPRSTVTGADRRGKQMAEQNKSAIELFFARNRMSSLIQFDNSKISVESRYVAWIDIMGSGNAMTNALRNASVYVGKLHDAVLKAHRNIPNRCSAHAMTDGVYVVAHQFSEIRDVVTSVMRSCAQAFAKEDEEGRRFIPRAAIAYGKIVDSGEMRKGLGRKVPNKDTDRYLHNVMVGIPFEKAHSSERKAPPFGIYIDESVRTQTVSPEEIVSWVLHRWWNPKTDQEFANEMGRIVQDHLKWAADNSLSTFFDPDRLDGYLDAVRQYFNLSEV